MRGVFSDGVNDPRAAALKRAYLRNGSTNLNACTKAVRAALERIDGSVTTYEMELKKMSRRGIRIW